MLPLVIAGLPGEQFVLPDAVAATRHIRRQPFDGRFIAIAASDPANLLGSLLPGDRVPRIFGALMAFRDGIPVATSVGGQVAFLTKLDAQVRRDTEATLRRSSVVLPARDTESSV